MTDLLKALGSITCCILTFVSIITIEPTILGFILGILFILAAYKLAKSISEETYKMAEEAEKLKQKQQLENGYKCPNCGKCAGHEISTVKKAVSVGTLGLASNKIGKNYECKNCGYKW